MMEEATTSRAMPFLVALACVGVAWNLWHGRDLHPPAGVLVAEEPAQSAVAAVTAAVRQDRFVLLPRATYRISARLLSRETYRLGDGADLAPVDFAVGWGPMSDSAVLDALDIGQSGRFFHLSWRDPPIPVEEMMDHAANMHLIPADASVKKALSRMRPGQLIHLEGLLVDARRDDGWHWDTSMTRTDSGDGACELMLVQAARAL